MLRELSTICIPDSIAPPSVKSIVYERYISKDGIPLITSTAMERTLPSNTNAGALTDNDTAEGGEKGEGSEIEGDGLSTIITLKLKILDRSLLICPILSAGI